MWSVAEGGKFHWFHGAPSYVDMGDEKIVRVGNSEEYSIGMTGNVVIIHEGRD